MMISAIGIYNYKKLILIRSFYYSMNNIKINNLGWY